MAQSQSKSEFKRIRKLIQRYRITNGKKFRLKDFDAEDTGGLNSEFKEASKAMLARGVELLADQQARLYAQDRWGVLLIFQAMDAAGKDGTIKHVTSGIDPQGMQVYSFKAPSSEELDHDYMWRCMKALPERGRIGVFNRSYYEEVLAVKVHQEFLMKQRLPQEVVGKNIWDQRYQDIRAIERYLSRNGYLILKFFLNVSKKEQKKRFMERLDYPEKNWKFSGADARERQYWKQYMECFEQMIRNTSTDYAPWYVIPADNKWYTRLAVSDAIVDALETLDLKFPKVDDVKKKELAAARKMLMSE